MNRAAQGLATEECCVPVLNSQSQKPTNEGQPPFL
jgi:hypothetical protein